MESAFSLAITDLKKIREKNKAEQNRRLEEVRLKNSRFAEIELELTKLGTALARCVLNGGENFVNVKASIQRLQNEKCTILTDLNLPQNYLDDIFDCANCHDTGYDEKGYKCSCLENLVTSHIDCSSNLTDYMKEQRFENFDFELFAKQPKDNGRDPLAFMKKIYKIGLSFAETFDVTHKNLLLTGNAGTGKTYFSSCIANHVLSRGNSVLYQTSFQMFDSLERLKFGRYTDDEAEQLNFLRSSVYNTDLLIIDDLGTEFISAYSTSVFLDILNTRILNGRSIILSTNLNSEELQEVYSNRLTSRLWGNFDIIQFIGKDLRIEQRRKNGEKND